MNWSLNEVEALARKAARGRGMSWGLAEETGKATRVLCEWGVDAPAALALLLQQHDGMAHEAVAPLQSTGPWQAYGGALCPIAAGCRISDLAEDLRAGPIEMRAVAHPVLLLGFAQMAARRLGQPAYLTLDTAQVCATADGIGVAGDLAAPPDTADVSAALSGEGFGTALAHHGRAEITDDTAAILTAFAQRTYAPATEASRLAGAGAGLSDND